MDENDLKRHHGFTGLEALIVLVAFVITAFVFTAVLLGWI